jgi:hypothetical protein
MMTAARCPARGEPANSQFFSTHLIRTDTALDPVIIDGQIAVIDVAGQRLPMFEAVVDRFGDRRSVGHFPALTRQPLAQMIRHRPGVLLLPAKTDRERRVSAPVHLPRHRS